MDSSKPWPTVIHLPPGSYEPPEDLFLEQYYLLDDEYAICTIPDSHWRHGVILSYGDMRFWVSWKRLGDPDASKLISSMTAQALEGSIRKWEAILDGTGTDEGIHNCPLCELFLDEDCEGCPVKESTEQSLCEGSPYDDWAHHDEDCELNDTLECEECRRLAQAELDFLISLRASVALS